VQGSANYLDSTKKGGRRFWTLKKLLRLMAGEENKKRKTGRFGRKVAGVTKEGHDKQWYQGEKKETVVKVDGPGTVSAGG